MRTKLKKWHIVLMSFVALFISIFTSLFNLKADTVDEEESPEELVENWSMDIVFYDSTVDSGNTPLTEINWNATKPDFDYGYGDTRVITVQLNYKNTNAVKTYQPGELKIYLERLFATTRTDFEWGRYLDDNKSNFFSYIEVDVIVGANDATHTGYKWDLVNTDTNNWIFSNAETIEEKSNFEGSIQVQYTIQSDYYLNYRNVIYELKASINKEINAFIPEVITSNNITFNYEREYHYTWEYLNYVITKTATTIPSLDGLPAGNYYWVKYNFELKAYNQQGNSVYYSYTDYPYIGATNHNIEDVFPEECLVLNSSLQTITPQDNNKYVFPVTTWGSAYNTSIIVGYPKEIYNDENNNLNIINHVDLYSKYSDSTEYVFMDDDEIPINLADFEFVYTGNLYGITKSFNNYGTTYSISLRGEETSLGDGGRISATLSPSAIFTGNLMDVKFGDDLLYITDPAGNYRKLEEDEYYFSYASFPYSLKNGNNQTIPEGKYNCELWIRRRGETNFTLHESFTNGTGGTIASYDPNGTGSWNFSETDAVVAYYFIIKDASESIKNASSSLYVTINNAQNIKDAGQIYNFGFIEVYINGELQNEPGIDSYANFITKEEIATFDQETYGHYIQRATSVRYYFQYQIPRPCYSAGTYKTMTFVQDAANECFTGSAKIDITTHTEFSMGISINEIQKFGTQIPVEHLCIGWELYDLLPEGMELASTKEEILNSLSTPHYTMSFYDVTGRELTRQEFFNLVKENLTLEITHNWNNTNRTRIKATIAFPDHPLFIYYGAQNYQNYIELSYNFKISYDAFLEYGNIWENTTYVKFHERNIDTYYFTNRAYMCNPTTDNGKIDPDALDINGNGYLKDDYAYYSASLTINSIISTHQDVTKYVKTDGIGYSNGIVDVANNAEYDYKLRVRTGNTDITNLIIYDSLETAQPERTRWQGQFLDVDVSATENKTYKLYRPNDPNADSKGYISQKIDVKTYYSKNPSESNLYNEDGTFNDNWKEYIPPEYTNGVRFTVKPQTTEGTLYVFYYDLDNKICHRSYSLYMLNRGDVIEVPTTDFYIMMEAYYYQSATYTILSMENAKVATWSPSGLSPAYNRVTKEMKDDEYIGQTLLQKENDKWVTYHYTWTKDPSIINDPTNNNDVKSLAFEFLDEEGNPAVIPKNNVASVEIKMKSPADENITTLARNDCKTQWNALDEFDQPVDFITGINSNVVKVALPRSIKTDDLPSISLKFTKEITGTDSQFENMKLNKADPQTFMIRLTSLIANDDGSYNQVTALLKSNQELIISQIPVGTYLLEELNDNYFDFVDFEENNGENIVINGVTFERTDQGYVLTVSEDLTENVEFNIKVTNEIESFRPYEDKDNKENLFLKNKINDNIIDPDDPEGH